MAQGLLSEKENADAEHFHWKHRCKRKGTRNLELTAKPTGLGLRIDVKCLLCGKTKDISDYDSW